MLSTEPGAGQFELDLGDEIPKPAGDLDRIEAAAMHNLSVAQHQRIRKELRKKYKNSTPSAMERARAKREIVGKFDDRIERPGKITRGLREMVAHGKRMPYGNNPDGHLKLPSPEGFDDLGAQPADNSAPGSDSGADSGSVASLRVCSVSTEGDTGPVSYEDASVPSQPTGDKDQSSADTPAS